MQTKIQKSKLKNLGRNSLNLTLLGHNWDHQSHCEGQKESSASRVETEAQLQHFFDVSKSWEKIKSWIGEKRSSETNCGKLLQSFSSTGGILCHTDLHKSKFNLFSYKSNGNGCAKAREFSHSLKVSHRFSQSTTPVSVRHRTYDENCCYRRLHIM